MNLLWWLVIYGAGSVVPPPATGVIDAAIGIGQKQSFSTQTVIGGGGSLA